MDNAIIRVCFLFLNHNSKAVKYYRKNYSSTYKYFEFTYPIISLYGYRNFKTRFYRFKKNNQTNNCTNKNYDSNTDYIKGVFLTHSINCIISQMKIKAPPPPVETAETFFNTIEFSSWDSISHYDISHISFLLIEILTVTALPVQYLHYKRFKSTTPTLCVGVLNPPHE